MFQIDSLHGFIGRRMRNFGLVEVVVLTPWSVTTYYFALTLYSPLTSLDVNGTGSLNVLSASTESLVFLWETDSPSLPFFLRDLANTNGLSLHVPISNMFAAAFRSLSANRLDLFL